MFLSNSLLLVRHGGENHYYKTYKNIIMKKVAKILASIVGIFALFIGIVSILAKKDSHIHITSKQMIAADVNEVYDQIRYLSKFPSWSPYILEDPNQKYRITGTDGQIGATFHWEGVDVEGIGSQTIMSMEDNQTVKMRCDIITPFEAKPEFEYQLKSIDGGVEVTQNFNVAMPFPSNVFSYLFGIRAEMRKINELGLGRLKEVLEKEDLTQR